MHLNTMKATYGNSTVNIIPSGEELEAFPPRLETDLQFFKNNWQ